jgi:hypothetical protein
MSTELFSSLVNSSDALSPASQYHHSNTMSPTTHLPLYPATQIQQHHQQSASIIPSINNNTTNVNYQQQQQQQQQYPGRMLQLDFDDVLQSYALRNARGNVDSNNIQNTPTLPSSPIVHQPQLGYHTLYGNTTTTTTTSYPVQSSTTTTTTTTKQQRSVPYFQPPVSANPLLQIERQLVQPTPITTNTTNNMDELLQILSKENQELKLQLQILQSTNDTLQNQVLFFRKQQEHLTNITQVENLIKNIFSSRSDIGVLLTDETGLIIGMNLVLRLYLGHPPIHQNVRPDEVWAVDPEETTLKYWHNIMDADCCYTSRIAFRDAANKKQICFSIPSPTFLKKVKPQSSLAHVRDLNNPNVERDVTILGNRNLAEGVLQARHLESHLIYDDLMRKVLCAVTLIHL